MKSLFLFLTLLGVSFYGHAQTGTLTGKIKDKLTGEPIIGATIAVVGTSKGASSDFNGDYTIPLDPGTYKVSISYVSYKTQTQENVKITAGQSTTLAINLETSATELSAVTVTGARQTNTEVSLIKEIKNSNVVVSGMSAEQITRTQDRDASETVRRIPGVTVVNNRFIVIRGMAERYNTVMLNDAFTPSTEPDVKSFSFDLLPTSVIDRILIYKSGSAELPGDFGGGVIKVYTKNVANENSTSFGISTSYRGNTTFNSFNNYSGSNTDFLGFDNGTRQLPGAFPANLNTVQSGDQLTNLGRTLPNIWQSTQTNALPDLRLAFGLSRVFDVKDVQISNITALSYSNTRSRTSGTRRRYDDEVNGESPLNYDFVDDLSTTSSRIGLVHNWSARLNPNNKIEFRNLFNQLGSSDALFRSGVEYPVAQDQRNYALRYESRSIYAGQFQGTHDINNQKTNITWNGGYTYTNRNEPDYRRIRTIRNLNTEDPFLISYKFSPSLNEAGRFYSKLNEHGFSLNSKIEHSFYKVDSLAENAPKIRAGFYAERRNRDFSSRFFSYSPANINEFDSDLLTQPLDQAFAPENVNRSTGWEIIEGTQPENSYVANNTYLAGFVGADVHLGDRLLASGGLRLEYNSQQLRLTEDSPLAVDRPITRLLPSLNLTYNFNQRSLLRFGSSMSLNRPEFRELAPFTYYDFINLWIIRGNPDLTTATIYNTDLRYEFYPTPSEMISFGVFGKYFQNSIERYFENVPAQNQLSFRNSDNAYNYGIETEIRKSLVDLSASSFIQKLTLVLNASLIKSEVKTTVYDEATGLVNNVERRPLTGQAPYIVNAGVYYQDDERKLQVNVLYNVVGTRIYAVGLEGVIPTVYEMPRNVVDVSLTKGIGEHFEFRAGISDLLNQKFRLLQDSDYNNKIENNDDAVQELRRGSYSTVGISYKF